MTEKTQETIKSPVIVCNSWGNYHVYPANIDFARDLVQEKIDELGEENVPGMSVLKMRKALTDNPDDLTIPYLVSDSIVLRAMSEILTLEVGNESRALYRISTSGVLEKDVKMPITKEVRDELILWSFDKKFEVKNASATALEKVRPESLSFMSGIVSRAKGHPINYVDDTDMEDAEEIQVLLHGKWKPTAKVENVVQRYLTFLNQYCHRDEKYDMGVMES
jgi:hypothetical protein